MQLIGPCKKCKSFFNVYENGDAVLKNPELMVCDRCAGRNKFSFSSIIRWFFGKAQEKPKHEKQNADINSKTPCPHCGDILLWSDDRGAHCDGCDAFDPEKDLSNNEEVLVSVREPRSEDCNEYGQVEAWNVDLGKFEKRFWFNFASHHLWTHLWTDEEREEIRRKWPKWRKIDNNQKAEAPLQFLPADRLATPTSIILRGRCKKCNRSSVVSENGNCEKCRKHVFWKHHIAKVYLEDPSLIKGNGVGKGGHLFKSLKNVDGSVYWVAPVLMEDGEFLDQGEVVESLVDKTGIGDFCPVDIWKKVLV